jgi:hypothetical protein
VLQLSQATYKKDEVLERATERDYAHPTETLAARRGCRSYHPNPAARPKATDHLIECTEILNHTPTFRDSGGLLTAPFRRSRDNTGVSQALRQPPLAHRIQR